MSLVAQLSCDCDDLRQHIERFPAGHFGLTPQSRSPLDGSDKSSRGYLRTAA
jgi:hypothetical protein